MYDQKEIDRLYKARLNCSIKKLKVEANQKALNFVVLEEVEINYKQTYDSMLNVIIRDFKKKSIKKIKDNRRKDFKAKMKINKHPKFKIMTKDWKEMRLFFKSTKIREDEVSDQLVRYF